MFSRFLLFTTLVAFVVVILGAYVRLSNAGLGCPDWPGCYGRMIVSAQGSDADLVKERPLEFGKALREMIHRYAAGTLGLLILFMTILAWYRRLSLRALRQRLRAKQSPERSREIATSSFDKLRTPRNESPGILFPTLLLILVIFQAALGMWTVTLRLHPFIVMAHLLGGFATLSLLWWLYLRTKNHNPSPPPLNLRGGVQSPPLRIRGGRGELRLPVTALLILILQIALGGWMSANYASIACPDFPTCHGEWFPPLHFREAFLVWREFGIDYEWGVLESMPRVTIHMMHRFGALITFAVLLITACRSMGQSRKAAIFLLAALVVQMSLGIANVVFHLPLAMAVAHNAVAALLLLGLITLLWTFKTFRPSTPA